MPTIMERVQMPYVQSRLAVLVAAMLDDPQKWSQGGWGVDREGDRIRDIERVPERAVCLCVGAALRLAIHRWFEVPMLDTGRYADELAKDYVAAAGIPSPVEPDLPGEHWLNAIIWWNDEPERTWEEVRAVAQAVVERTAARFETDNYGETFEVWRVADNGERLYLGELYCRDGGAAYREAARRAGVRVPELVPMPKKDRRS